eukprot:TRINITY_DN922_c0_g1_i1.p1 TRINITY_DN922_c0_g1~~TRINITY_DN922_c0_g1_i1.p1  ORF type:complete len:621 (-),score=167.52 TRINITY_DN922_c0_g1_i1:85-1947(-)
MRTACFGLLLLAAVGSALAAQEWCNGGNRTDCGYYGINQGQCESKGCCWVPTTELSLGGIPWCFFTSPASPACSTTPQCSGHGTCGTDQPTCTCSTGYATCGAVSANDCSVHTDGDVENCGGCGQACFNGAGVQTRTCQSGTCNVQCQSGYKYCFGSCAQTDDCSKVAPFSDDEINTFVGYFMKNIDVNGLGGVLASPSKSSPNYYYHWARDGAISMYEMMNVKSFAEADQHLKNYVNWAFNKIQKETCNSGTDVRGEPKFMIDGSCFTDGWMRPQNDAAGLRSITMIRYANMLIANGQKDFVTSQMYHQDTSLTGIKRDLEYAAQIWDQPTGDPWEEVRGQVFFQKMVSRRALLEGATLATTLGDSGAATYYKSVAASIEKDIMANHWSASKGILMEVPNTRELDSASHLAVLYGDAGDGFLSASSQEVQSSVSVLINSFKTYFQINVKDTASGIPGVLVGRYLYDSYAGGNSSQPGGGNPWVLCSSSLAEIFYRAAAEHASLGYINITDVNGGFWKNVVELSGVSVNGLEQGAVLSLNQSPALFLQTLQALTMSGDSILLRVRHHVKDQDFHMTEQINKDSGAPQGAQDLTWSYGTVIGAMTARKNAIKSVESLAALL